MQTWMWCIGLSKETETYHIRGLGSHDSPYRTRASRWVYMVRGAVDEETNDIEASLVLARDMERHVRSNATKKWAIGKPKLGSARRLRGIYFIDPAGADFKETIRNARKKLEVPMSAAMPCKIREKRSRSLSQDEIRMHRWSRRIYEKALMPKAMKIPDAKALANKEWKKSRKYWHGTWRKSETKKRWSMKQGKKAEQCT